MTLIFLVGQGGFSVLVVRTHRLNLFSVDVIEASITRLVRDGRKSKTTVRRRVADIFPLD